MDAVYSERQNRGERESVSKGEDFQGSMSMGAPLLSFPLRDLNEIDSLRPHLHPDRIMNFGLNISCMLAMGTDFEGVT